MDAHCRTCVCTIGRQCLESPLSIFDKAMMGKCHLCDADMGLGERLEDMLCDLSHTRATDYRMIRIPNLFRRLGYENLKGRDWLRRIEPSDRELFSKFGRIWAAEGKSGGIARIIRGARRDSHGRFIADGTGDEHAH